MLDTDSWMYTPHPHPAISSNTDHKIELIRKNESENIKKKQQRQFVLLRYMPFYRVLGVESNYIIF